MELNHASIYNKSVLKTSKRMSYYGDADIEKISLLKLIYKHASYSGCQSCLRKLDEIISYLQISAPDICMEYIDGDFFVGNINDHDSTLFENTSNRPTVDGDSVLLEDDEFIFSISNFTNNFQDLDGDSYGSVVIRTLPVNGELFVNDVPAFVNQVVDDPSLIKYVRSSDESYSTTFQFGIYDDNQDNPLISNNANITINVSALNYPAEIGDLTKYANNREITVFTLNDFTSALIDPYNDPENDDIDAIRIDDVSNANLGRYLYYGVEVVVGQIISADDIEAGNFTHEGANIDSVSTDSFVFSARDKGSLKWVS